MGRIIGLTGKFAAGKGTVAEILKARGFSYHSLSDVIREELAAQGIEESRENLLAMGNALRNEGGPSALASKIRTRLLDGGLHIVDSIRNPAEVDVLRTCPQFVLLGVDADQRLRFERLRERARIGDPETFEAFADLEAREMASSDPNKQQLLATWQMADVIIQNNSDLAALEAELNAVLKRLA